MFPILNFPNEILFEIASFLEFHDLLRFQLTCSQVNDVGQLLLNSKETLVSAFYLFCKSAHFQLIDSRDTILLQRINNRCKRKKYKHKIIFFHHNTKSNPFIITTRKQFLDEFGELNTHHCQLSYSSIAKILTIRYTRDSYFTPKRLIYDLTTGQQEILVLNESVQLCGQEALFMPFHCLQLNNQHFYYMGRRDQYRYLFVLDGKKSGLSLKSISTIRIIRSTGNDAPANITLITDYYFLSLMIDFSTKMVNMCGMYQLVVDITEVRDSDIDLYVVSGLVYQYHKFRPLLVSVVDQVPQDFNYCFVDL